MSSARTADSLVQLVRELVALPRETPWLEFKHNNANPEEIGGYISALANSAALADKASAYLVWGIKDGTHEIVGTTFSPHAETMRYPSLGGEQEGRRGRMTPVLLDLARALGRLADGFVPSFSTLGAFDGHLTAGLPSVAIVRVAACGRASLGSPRGGGEAAVDALTGNIDLSKEPS